MFSLIKSNLMVSKFLFFILLISCRPEVALVEQGSGGQVSLEIPTLGISRAETVDWKLGKKREKTISKGVLVALELPDIKTTLGKQIYKKGADSWIVKTVKQSKGTRDILSFGYVPFIIAENIINGELAVSKSSKHFLQISYSGVRVPKRLEKKNCPIYGHKKIVDDFSIKKNWQDDAVILLRKMGTEPGRHYRSSLDPHEIDAGNSIVGKYYFYIALMNSKTKTLMSKYVPYGEFLEISSEHDGELGTECLGVSPI